MHLGRVHALRGRARCSLEEECSRLLGGGEYGRIGALEAASRRAHLCSFPLSLYYLGKFCAYVLKTVLSPFLLLLQEEQIKPNGKI